MVSREYLSFTKRERTGIIVLVILLIIMAVMPKFFCNPKPVVEKLSGKQVERLAEKNTNYYPGRRYRERDTVYVHKYIYPGYSPKKYQRFNETSNSLYREGNRAERKFSVQRGGNSDTNRRSFVPRSGWVTGKRSSARVVLQPIDINTADTSAFIALPGIGSKLANRIVSFRTKLGGFNSVEQIRKVYGLQDSVFMLISPFLKCDNPAIVMAQRAP